MKLNQFIFKQNFQHLRKQDFKIKTYTWTNALNSYVCENSKQTLLKKHICEPSYGKHRNKALKNEIGFIYGLLPL